VRARCCPATFARYSWQERKRQVSFRVPLGESDCGACGCGAKICRYCSRLVQVRYNAKHNAELDPRVGLIQAILLSLDGALTEQTAPTFFPAPDRNTPPSDDCC